MKLRLITLYLVLVQAVVPFAQQHRYVQFKNIETAHYGAEQLVNLVWDEEGNFWARSENGIIRHNGYSKKEFGIDPANGIASNKIVGISKTDSNEIWISYLDTNILTKLVPDSEKFTHFQVKELMTDSVLTGVVVRVKKDHSGQLWLCTWGSGLIKFNEDVAPNIVYQFGDTTRNAEVGKYIKDLVIHEDNSMFVTFFLGGQGENSFPGFFDPKTEEFRRLDLESYLDHLPKYAQNHVAIASQIIHFVYQDERGNYWLGSYSGLLFLDMQNGTIERISERGEDPKLLNQVNVQNYVVSGDQLWIATYNKGVMVVDMLTKEVNFHYTEPLNSSSLNSNKISSISKDPQGNVWISNGSGMLSIYVPYIHNFKVMYWNDMNLEYSNRSAQNIPVNQLYVNNSREIYVSSKIGLLQYDYNTMNLSNFFAFQFPKTNWQDDKHRGRNKGVENFKILGDEIFFAFNTFPSVYNLKTGNLEINNKVWGHIKIAFRHDRKVEKRIVFREGKNGTVFFDLTGSLEFPDQPFVRFEDKIFISETFSFETNQGNWIFSESSGRFVIYKPKDTVYNLFSPSQAESYFPDSTVVCALIQASDEILIGTKNGLYSFNEVTYEYEDISEKVGLKEGEGINSMVKDDYGKVWMALSTELLCWNPGDGTTQRYNKTLGVNVSNFLPAIGQKDEMGNLYFATMYGILIFNPRDVLLPEDPIRVTLSSVNVNDQLLDNVAMGELLTGEKEFSWDENFIEFYFHTNQVFELSPHQFSYKLEGLNEHWISCGSSNHVRFDNLQYGEYELLFKVENAYHVESDVFHLPFKIRKPFWLTYWFLTLVIFAFLGILYLVVIGRIKALRKRSELLERTVEERTVEVVEQKQEAERQREMVEEKQKEITDSITYAKRIQDAILPSKDLISAYLPNSFVMYRPKDIVAGDFYWLEPISKDEVIFAAADCTGHGVPGAMVSVVCNNAMNRTVREFKITDPGKLLDNTRDLVIDQFERTAIQVMGSGEANNQSQGTIKDGMDISLCYWNKASNQIVWSGANNPIWLIRAGELIEIKGNKQPVGKFDPSESFTSHQLEVQKDDLIYLFTDGYADQFGGEKGKKFKSSSLKQLILSIHKLPMNEQLARMEKEFDLWKGDYEQLDDVCVIGVRV